MSFFFLGNSYFLNDLRISPVGMLGRFCLTKKKKRKEKNKTFFGITSNGAMDKSLIDYTFLFHPMFDSDYE